QMDIEISPDKKQFLNREQVTLNIEAKDAEGKPLSTDIALAVTDGQLAVKDQNDMHILSYLLLSSDLKGFVEEPGYYFNPENNDRYEALDLLLMTQGWRRFTWQEIVTDSFPKMDHSPELDIKIRGRLLKDNGDPVQKGEALLFLKDKYETFLATETDEKGNFVFDGFHFRDSIEVLVQGKDQKGKFNNVNVQLERRSFSPDNLEGLIPLSKHMDERINRQYIPPALPLFQGMESDIGSMELGEFLLEEVVVEGKAEISEPFRLHRNADVVIDASQLPPAPSGNILQVLQGRVAGLQITPGGPNQFNAVIRGQGTPLFLLDGMPIDAGMLQSINQFDISRVEVLKSPGNNGIYGGRGEGGVIALYTHRGNESIEEPEAGDHITVQRIGGFSKTRQFYVPPYDENNGPDVRDERSTIFWSPNVKTNENGQATVRFFTSDRNTFYRVIGEGISEKGKPGKSELFLEVY
ncbi:MAG: TonB-dependent receptor plug domain-containing protein, partial [Cyclobacteriaceae bacterium]